MSMFVKKSGKEVNMPESGLFGSYPLTSQKIDEVVRGIGAGAYALGYKSNDATVFYVQRIGRSDTDLNARLHDYVNGKYERFKYAFYDNAEQAFYKECRLFHDFSPEDNPIHPDKPNGTNYKCPVCGG